MLVHEFLESNSANAGSRTAIVYLDKSITYRELDIRANRLAVYLIEQGVHMGDRVAILVEPSIDYAISYFGILKAGAVVVGLNTATTSRLLRNLINDCQAQAIIIQSQYQHFLAEVIDDLPSLRLIITDGPSQKLIGQSDRKIGQFSNIVENDRTKNPRISISGSSLATIIYTSGTTGNPKGVMLSHRNLEANTDSIIEYLQLKENDKVMAVLPFYYSYGHSLLLTHIKAGGCIVIDNRFAYPNTITEIMSKEEVTGFAGVPTTFAILLHKSNFARHKWEHLRYITQAGGPMAPALTMKLKEAVPHIKIYVMYGQTEASARLSYLEPEKLESKIGSIGRAIPGVKLTLRDEFGNICPPGTLGEIVAEGDNIMQGYWNQPDETARVLKADGLHTGDLARADDDGYLYIVGRNSEMIKTGAHRISPKEIEEIIQEHEAVLESAAIGVPDEIMGEIIKVIVVPRDDAEVTERDIIIHCSKNLPPFKIPRIVEFRDSLPKTTSGKIMRSQLKNIKTIA